MFSGRAQSTGRACECTGQVFIKRLAQLHLFLDALCRNRIRYRPAAFVPQHGRFSSPVHSALRSSSDMFVTTCPLFSHSSIPIWTMNMGDSQVQDCGGRACPCGQEVSADFTCLRVVRMCWCATTLLCWCDGCGRNTHGADDAESTVQCIISVTQVTLSSCCEIALAQAGCRDALPMATPVVGSRFLLMTRHVLLVDLVFVW